MDAEKNYVGVLFIEDSPIAKAVVPATWVNVIDKVGKKGTSRWPNNGDVESLVKKRAPPKASWGTFPCEIFCRTSKYFFYQLLHVRSLLR